MCFYYYIIPSSTDYVLLQIECCIDEWVTGLKEDIKFTSAAYVSVYHGHLDSLQRFGERTAPYKLLDKICCDLHDIARYVLLCLSEHYSNILFQACMLGQTPSSCHLSTASLMKHLTLLFVNISSLYRLKLEGLRGLKMKLAMQKALKNEYSGSKSRISLPP